MLPDKITLDVVTPTRRVVTEDVDEVVFPASEGYMGVRPGHTALLAGLGIGVLTWTRSGRKREMAVARGYAEILPDRVSVLAEAAELAEEIDPQRARDSRERATGRLAAAEQEVDIEQAQAAVARAEARLRIAGDGGGRKDGP